MFGERLKSLRTQKGLTQQQLADITGVSTMTVRNWESNVKRPSMDAILSLVEAMGVSSDTLLGINSTHPPVVLNKDEDELITNYRLIDDASKNIVRTLCRMERNRTAHVMNRFTEVISTANQSERFIPHYSAPSAAGFNAPLDSDDFEMIPVVGSVPHDADFAVDIQGNSMYPYIKDGDTIFVKKTSDISIGDIGIFSVDGAMYCKQYYIDELGDLHLISLNPALKSTNITVYQDSSRTVKCYGKVLIDCKINIPEYIFE